MTSVNANITLTVEEDGGGNMPDGNDSNNNQEGRPERKRDGKRPVLLYIFAVLLAIAMVALGGTGYMLYANMPHSKELFFVAVVIAMLLSFLTSAQMVRDHAQQQQDEQEDFKEELNGISTQAVEPLEHMKLNLSSINEYYSWSKTQALITHLLAIVLCLVGLAIMILGYISEKMNGGDNALAIIPVIGGAVTELLGGTIFVIYKLSLSTFNRYHDFLHENERFLTCVSLLDKFSDKAIREEVLKHLISSEIALNRAVYEDAMVGDDKNRT